MDLVMETGWRQVKFGCWGVEKGWESLMKEFWVASLEGEAV